jgi:hypothetical protein
MGFDISENMQVTHIARIPAPRSAAPDPHLPKTQCDEGSLMELSVADYAGAEVISINRFTRKLNEE